MSGFFAKSLFALFLCGSVWLALGPRPQAADTTLTLSSWLPPDHPIVVQAIEPWARQVEEATEGRVAVHLLSEPLGPVSAHYDLARDGSADITYGMHAFTPGNRFPRARLGQFSFVGDDAASASAAYWNVYGGSLAAQAEHQDTKVLGLFLHGPGLLYATDVRIDEPDDLEELRIRVPGGYVADLLGGMGAITLVLPAVKLHETLERGVLDGVALTYAGGPAFGLPGLVRYAMTVPGGLYNSSWFLVMNETTWERLSPADRAAIERVSGPAFARLVGQAFDAADAEAIDRLLQAKIEIYQAPPQMLEAIRRDAAELEAAWAAETAAAGYDGAAALAELRRQAGVTP